jgi:epoxyqueuosine reductase QueG
MINTIILNSLDKPDDYIVGYAGLNGIIKDSAFPYGIVIGKRLDDKIIDSISIGPTLEYFNYYKSINNQLSGIIHQIGNKIMENGYACEIVEPSNDNSGLENKEYELTLRTPVSHKMIGTRAGLGWIGKTDLFISKKFGPRLRLVSLLTDYPLEISESPINKSRCGNCSECVINCPANAATGALWDIYTDRDVFFDAHKCRNKCRELSKSRLNLNSSTCGICISVCPVGKLKQKTEE